MPRAGLSRGAVVDLALASIDDDDDVRAFADLTLAAVAARAGVAVPSLYKHVDGLGDLRREVALAATAELTDAVRAAAAAEPGSVPAAARAVRGYALAHPGRYAALQHAPDPVDPADADFRTAAEGAVLAIAGVLRASGIVADAASDDLLVDTVRALRAAVHGFVMLELQGGFGLPRDAEASFDFLVAALEAGLRQTARRAR